MTIEELLHGSSAVLFDGAAGTEYLSRGLRPGSPPEILNVEHPDIVLEIHRSYIEAGADVIETNSFGSNRMRLASAGIGGRCAELTKASVRLAQSASQGKVLIAGSVGPLGVLIEPYGETSVVQAMDCFEEQIRILHESGIQLVMIETMISLDEALIALEAAQRSGAKHIAASMTFESTPSGPRTPFGESATQCFEALLKRGAMFVGANCGNGFQIVESVVDEVEPVISPSQLILQPNAGLPTLEKGSMRYPETPSRFGSFVRKMAAKNVRCLGGCCGTSPAHIAEARRRLDVIRWS